MAKFRTINKYVDIETGEIIFPFNNTEYYIVKKNKKTFQPNRTKAFFITEIINLCRKNNQTAMNL